MHVSTVRRDRGVQPQEFKIASATVDAHGMRFAVSRGTRRPFAILAWVLFPLTLLILGAGIWQSQQSSAATLAQQQRAVHVLGEEAALQRVGRTVQLPTDFRANTSADPFLVSCGHNVGTVGCWIDENDVATVTREIANASAAAGLRPTTTCSGPGSDCRVVARLKRGELWFTVISQQRDSAATTATAADNPNNETGKTDVRALVLPDDLHDG